MSLDVALTTYRPRHDRTSPPPVPLKETSAHTNQGIEQAYECHHQIWHPPPVPSPHATGQGCSYQCGLLGPSSSPHTQDAVCLTLPACEGCRACSWPAARAPPGSPGCSAIIHTDRQRHATTSGSVVLEGRDQTGMRQRLCVRAKSAAFKAMCELGGAQAGIYGYTDVRVAGGRCI